MKGRLPLGGGEHLLEPAGYKTKYKTLKLQKRSDLTLGSLQSGCLV